MCDKNGMGFWVNGKERYFVIFMEGDVDLVICDENNFNEMYLAFVNDCREQGGTLYKQNPREESAGMTKREEKYLDKRMLIDGHAITHRKFIEDAVEKGWKAEAHMVEDDEEYRRVMDEYAAEASNWRSRADGEWVKIRDLHDKYKKEYPMKVDEYRLYIGDDEYYPISKTCFKYYNFLMGRDGVKKNPVGEGEEEIDMEDDDKIDMSEVRENPGGTLFSKPEFKKYAKMIKITSVKDARDSIHKLNEEWKGATHAKKVRLIRVAVLAANRCAAMIKRKKRPLKAGTKVEKRKVEKIYRDWVKAHTLANPPEVDEVNDMEEEVKVEEAPKENPAEASVVDESETEAEEVSEDVVEEDTAPEEAMEAPVENPPESEVEVVVEEAETDSEPKVEEESDEVVENPPSEEEAEPVNLVQKTLDVVVKEKKNPPEDEGEGKEEVVENPRPKHVLQFYGWSNPVDGKRIAIYHCKNCGKFFRIRAGEKR